MSPGPTSRYIRFDGVTTVNPALPGAGVATYTPSWRFVKLNVPVASVTVLSVVKPGNVVVQPATGPVGGDVAPAESSQRTSETVIPAIGVPSEALVITPLATVVLKRNVKFVRPSKNTVLVL